jgi:TRAP transporter 4TM/12TM fusion protein
MGAAAFVMAGITGIPYIRICAASIIPAILYFTIAGLYIYLQAGKLNISPSNEQIDIRDMLLSAPLFLFPLAVLILLLIKGYTAMYAVFWAFMILIILSLVRRETRPSLSEWVKSFTRGAILGSQIGVCCALIGLIIVPITSTGLGIKIPAAVEAWSGGNLAIALLITMVISIILGCGLPTAAVYVLVAIVTAPVLLKMGLSVMQAHFFVFYFGCLCFITPPVGIGSLVASQLAGSSFFKTAVESMKVAIAGFAIPFLMIWCPLIILDPRGGMILEIMALAAGILGLVVLQMAVCNYFLTELSLTERLLCMAAAALFLVFSAMKGCLLLLAGIVLFLFLTLKQYINRSIDSEH